MVSLLTSYDFCSFEYVNIITVVSIMYFEGKKILRIGNSRKIKVAQHCLDLGGKAWEMRSGWLRVLFWVDKNYLTLIVVIAVELCQSA